MFGPRAAAPSAAALVPPAEAPAPAPKLSLDVRMRATAVAMANPHCRQILAPSIAAHFPDGFEPRPFAELPVELTADAPRIPYRGRDAEARSTAPRGQRKLFLAEVDFLARWTEACFGENHVVVYAGAAPGFHIPTLAGLFWSCHFLLYDPAPFCPRLCRAPPANVTVHQSFFVGDIAADLAARYGDRLVFICDIRTGRDECYVQADMERQKAWTRILNPTAALLKFRLPWGGGETPYFDGSVLLQAYPPQASTETRLAVTRAQIAAPERLYDNLTYEEQLAYHNAVGRVRTYSHGVRLPGLDGCFDCATAVRVAAGYMARGTRSPPPLVAGTRPAPWSAPGAPRSPPGAPPRSPPGVPLRSPPRSPPGPQSPSDDAQAAATFLREAFSDFEPTFREAAAANPAEHRWTLPRPVIENRSQTLHPIPGGAPR